MFVRMRRLFGFKDGFPDLLVGVLSLHQVDIAYFYSSLMDFYKYADNRVELQLKPGKSRTCAAVVSGGK